MPTAIVTGSGGLVGSETVRALAVEGWTVLGVDNDARGTFFGPEASTAPMTEALAAEHAGFRSFPVDVRDADALARIVRRAGRELELVVHAAAQPSHDWAAHDPVTDFAINATGTLNLLEAVRHHAPGATFAFLSTNKVYGDHPNALPLRAHDDRLDLPHDHPYFDGIDTSMALDASLHSLFGVSKTSADLLVQEYGRYFGMATVCLRCGCLTGAAHAGTQLHGFLSYLMRCAMEGRTYRVIGYDGLQVRDNLHARDVAAAILAFHRAPRPGAVYNLGGGRGASCSVREAIALAEELTGAPMQLEHEPEPRRGDHRWWITDLAPFRADYPGWRPTADVRSLLEEIQAGNAERWTALESVWP